MSKGKIIAALGVVVALGGAVAAFALAGASAVDVEVAEVTRGELAVTVSAAGSVEGADAVDVYPPTAGTLASVLVTEGASVKVGDVIAVMDTAPLEAQLAQAEAAYRGALAQRDAAANSAPGSDDYRAASAAADAAWSAYVAAKQQYEATAAGLGGPSPADIAEAEAAVALAQSAYDAAAAAYTDFHTNVYLPAPTPRDPSLETALAALAFARDQASANLNAARQALAALLASANNDAAVDAAQAAVDQAYAAYLGAVSQRSALARAASIGAALDSADAAIAAAEQARDLAESTLARARITAPASGMVLFNSASSALPGVPVIKPGPGSSVSPASAPFSIVSTGSVTFVAQVDEADIASVDVGMSAEVLLDSLSDRVFDTKVASVDVRSVLTPTGGTAFPVRFRLQHDASERVLIGMNGSVDIQVDLVADALKMPVEAILEKDGGTFAYVVRAGRAKKVPITVGRFTDTHAEVLSGLAAGDDVIVSDVSLLADGVRVRVR